MGKLKYILLGGLILSSTLFLSFVLVSACISISQKRRKLSSSMEFPFYRRTKDNSVTKDSSVGFSRMDSDFLDWSDNLSDEDSDGNTFLPSRIEEEEFLCEGSCLCGVSGRRTSTLLSRGIIHLVAATSSLVAYSEAKGFFDEKCRLDYQEECSTSSVVSEVNECRSGTPILEEVKDVSDDLDYRRFSCIGHCLPKKLRKKEARDVAMDFGCENMYVQQNVIVGNKNTGYWTRAAIESFIKDFLTPYCRDNSVTRFGYEFKGGYKSYKSISICCAVNQKTKNKTVKCHQTYPMPWSRGG